MQEASAMVTHKCSNTDCRAGSGEHPVNFIRLDSELLAEQAPPSVVCLQTIVEDAFVMAKTAVPRRLCRRCNCEADVQKHKFR